MHLCFPLLILDQQIRHPVHRLDTGQLRSLQEKVTHLQHFLEHQSQIKISQVVEDLARQIPVVANEAEDVIDSHVVFQLASQDTSSERDAAAALSSFYEDLDQVIQKIDSIIKELNGVAKEELVDVKEPKLVADSLPNNASSSRVLPSSGENSTMVGFDLRLVQIIDELTRDESDLKILRLLGWEVFGQEGCPFPELEQIGKDIAKGCRGLPLALVVIGGLLAKSNMTREYWESVSKNINSFANSEDNEYCLKVLSLTYNNLPIHLKSCFLFMRVFPEDKTIMVSKLIRLWVAEGFIKLVRGKTLEEVAESYLKDLIGVNLIFISEWKRTGKIKSIRIHDLLRDLCLRESDKENLFVSQEYKGFTVWKRLQTSATYVIMKHSYGMEG
ncbi:UNVERIFIED_CONTAM: putative late blight resistance proteinR1C-3 [Sesamum calycinum]|uniref:Late blight resistance proteinR1C-3 n=1 Tax=Sesamum calycinum TaxID=2727403 RepID=A0AAW2SD75_9LAMI